MKNGTGTLKTFKCYIPKYFDGQDLSSNHVAKTAAAARYQFYQEHEFDCGYAKVFSEIKSKSLGLVKPDHFFGSAEQFERIVKYRGIEFAYQGMAIDVAGRKGIIVGGNSSSNLDVLFDGGTAPSNCHPNYETTYYGEDGEIIKDFKEKK